MEAPTLPVPDRLERIVTLVDTAIAGRGWHCPHLLIAVERGGDAGTFELRLRELSDGQHPVDELLGFVAPDEWFAIGAVTYGWAAPVDDHAVRPSRHPDRCRARVTSIVDRDGHEAVTTALDDGRVIDEPGISVLADVLRRCLGAPTDPPPPVQAFRDVVWVQAILDARPRTWDDTLALRDQGPPADVTWTHLRHLARDTREFGDLALWMDDGMFARWQLGGRPTLTTLLAEADRSLPAQLARRLRDSLLDD